MQLNGENLIKNEIRSTNSYRIRIQIRQVIYNGFQNWRVYLIESDFVYMNDRICVYLFQCFVVMRFWRWLGIFLKMNPTKKKNQNCKNGFCKNSNMRIIHLLSFSHQNPWFLQANILFTIERVKYVMSLNT